MNPQQFFSIAATSLLAVACGSSAQAATVNYDFTVVIDSGPFKPRTYAGHFSYDGAQVPGLNLFGETTFALNSFSMVFEGVTLSLADFSPAAPLLWTLPAGETPGLDGAAAAYSFVTGAGGFAPSFAYDRRGGIAGFGSVSFVPGLVVPEPASVALVLLGLGLGLGRARRRLS